MMSEKNCNTNCPHAAEIVSYLYNEIGAGEKAIFESHLATCRDCAAELADFSLARFAVKDWRDAEFARLETPPIEIPFETSPSKKADSAVSDSFLARLRRFFSPRPMWATGAAALAIVLGVVLTATTLLRSDFIVENKPVVSADNSALPPAKTVPPPQPAASAAPEIVNSTVVSPPSPNKKTAPENREIVRRDETPNSQKNSTVRDSADSPKTVNGREGGENIAASSLRQSSDSAPKTRARTNRPVPTLNSFDEEEEDETLRLAEMFEEIDAGE